MTAWDISEEALAVARRNNEVLGSAVSFQQKDVLAEIDSEQRFDIIVSNPPYVTESEKADMEPNVLDWEPELALFVPDNDPLRFYRRIAVLGRKLLNPGGKLYFEINRAYGCEIVCMLIDLGYCHPCIIKDISGNDRIVTTHK